MNCKGLLSCLFSVLFVIWISVKSSTHEQNLANFTPFWHFLCQVNHAAMPPTFPSTALLYLQPPNGSNISSIFSDTPSYLTIPHFYPPKFSLMWIFSHGIGGATEGKSTNRTNCLLKVWKATTAPLSKCWSWPIMFSFTSLIHKLVSQTWFFLLNWL